MKPIDYLHLQLELEGIKAGSGNLITRASPDVGEFPLVLSASTADKQKYIYFDSSLPIALYEKLIASDPQSFEIEYAIEVFNSFGISTKSGHFKTYIFPDDFTAVDIENVQCLNQDDPKIVDFGFSGLADQVYANEHEGIILSACVSSRQNFNAAEAWVFTHPDHGGKGLAQQVVTAWASSLQRKGIIPFYSHALENTNSANLASKIGLILIFEESVIDHVE
jgi:hypothetical protein